MPGPGRPLTTTARSPGQDAAAIYGTDRVANDHAAVAIHIQPAMIAIIGLQGLGAGGGVRSSTFQKSQAAQTRAAADA